MSEIELLGSFEEQVMLAIVRTAGEAYGMVVRRELERVTGRELTIGAVYATLDRLESKRLVRSVRADVEGSSRRVFAVTRRGAEALADTRAIRERLWKGVDVERGVGLDRVSGDAPLLLAQSESDRRRPTYARMRVAAYVSVRIS
jgi:PadR family transcriptional regulator PadR